MQKYLGVTRNLYRSFTSLPNFFKVSEEVTESLSSNKPIVALESTVITHGLPFPENIKTATAIEEIVRQNNATPATIGILNGEVHIGMNSTEMTSLASNKNVLKVSRRDLPYIISQHLNGGTTVAATMALAYRSGISVFATGGIGGVHRGGETSMDVSADLYELSRTPIAVVSAGVKSILDIGRTLEYLETLGVCVAAFGASKDFPAFFTPKSNFKAPCNVETYEEAARLIDSRNQLELEGGVLIAVPIPEEYHEQGLHTESVIEEALKEARENKILGRDVTPFVLKRVQELSGGAALEANIGLLKNNARVGSEIAVALNHLNNSRSGPISSRSLRAPVTHEAKNVFSSLGRPVVFGGSILDIHVKALEDIKTDGRTLDGKVESTAGGVGRNLADCLARLQLNPFLVSCVGAKEHAQALLSKMNHMDTSGIKIVADVRTATCIVVLDHRGECLFVIGDMGVHDSLVPEQVESHRSIMSAAPLVVIDGNISLKSLDRIFQLCSENQIPVWFEPTDLSRAMRPFQASAMWRSALAYASPNLNELRVMHNAVFRTDFQLSEGVGDDLDGILNECLTLGIRLLEHSLHTLVVTLGLHGALLLTKLCPESYFPFGKGSIPAVGKPRALHYPAPKPEKIVSVSGAGDCFAAGMIGSILKGLKQDECIRSGQKAALLSLASHIAVPNSIFPKSIFSAERSESQNPVSVVV